MGRCLARYRSVWVSCHDGLLVYSGRGFYLRVEKRRARVGLAADFGFGMHEFNFVLELA